MKKFKSIMWAYHTKNRECLHDLYTDRQVYYSSVSSANQPMEEEKIFEYRSVSFQFTGTGFRTPERMVLYVWIPEEICFSEYSIHSFKTAYEDWLLRLLASSANALSESFQNDHKDTREKPSFSMQEPGAVVLSRNGCLYIAEKHAFRLRITFQFPLINGCFLHGKNSYKGIKALLDLICDKLDTADRAALAEHIQLYSNQRQIRTFLKENGLLAFIADGSILPRQDTTKLPLPGAIPFQTPPSLKVTIHTSDGYTFTGMGLKSGITVITGGGYSGKSTLLDCLEQGIYDHVKGDGREYVISDESACKVYAEDGRYLPPTDLSPFFSYLPGNNNPHCFRTSHASGSVSQAANIVEAVYGGSRCLLIDEDTSATNFMIRDETMRRLVKNEPIIPYTDRILELKESGISTVLVIGGSGEYLKYADRILLLEDYLVSDVTDQIDRSRHPAPASKTHSWMHNKCLVCAEEGTPFSYGQCVQIEHARYLKIGSFTADITRLTALTEIGQPGSLVWLLEKLLCTDSGTDNDLRTRCEAAVKTLFSDSIDTVLSSRAHSYELWLEQVRSLDLIMAACRLRLDAT